MHRLLQIAMVLALVIAATTLSACGKKGELDPPGDKPSTYPKQYPDPSTL